MNYTQNHHLPQWVKSDRIMMDDFNQMCRDIESGMTANAQAAASAQSTANTAKPAAGNAQSTADTALSAANAAKSAAATAQSTANTARQEAAVLPYAVGTYTGSYANKTINVGFRPSFVFINGHAEASTLDQLRPFGAYACATAGGGTVGSCVKFTSTGFTVMENTTKIPDLTDNGRVYEYIAFR